MSIAIGVRLPDWLVEGIDSEAKIRKENRSAYIRRVVGERVMQDRGVDGRHAGTGSTAGRKGSRRNAAGRK